MLTTRIGVERDQDRVVSDNTAFDESLSWCWQTNTFAKIMVMVVCGEVLHGTGPAVLEDGSDVVEGVCE